MRPARLTGAAGTGAAGTGAAGTGAAGSHASPAGCGLPPPLTALYEQEGLPAWGLPSALADVYGGDLGFRQPCVYANFVASVDGVTALGPEYPSSGSAISGHAPAAGAAARRRARGGP